MLKELRNLLKISKPNNPNCFKKNGIIHSYHTPFKRGIIYVRLSQEDLDKELGNVSKSILNQLLMLLTFCNNKDIEVVGIFYEEDISGSDGSRQEWNKTLLFCELGNTDIYVCKTQARFARSIEFVEKYCDEICDEEIIDGVYYYLIDDGCDFDFSIEKIVSHFVMNYIYENYNDPKLSPIMRYLKSNDCVNILFIQSFIYSFYWIF